VVTHQRDGLPWLLIFAMGVVYALMRWRSNSTATAAAMHSQCCNGKPRARLARVAARTHSLDCGNSGQFDRVLILPYTHGARFPRRNAGG
jgi:hypothetical protein